MVKYNLLLFILVLLMYSVTIFGNFLMIMIVYYRKTLHSPMYFLLSQLSVSDIMLSTDIAPNMLNIVLHERTAISFPAFITQFFFFDFIEVFECFLLTVMSYDRYLAICSRLRCASIMSHGLCIKFVLASWLLSFCAALIITVAVSQLEFCGPNTIDHFYCDFNPLVELSCSGSSMVQIEATFLSFPVIVFPFFVIVVSYIYIVLTILKISSFSGKLKSFSWLLSFAIALILTVGICELEFCGPNTIDHFYCDFNPLVKLSCSDTSRVQMELTLLCFPVIVFPFLVIVVSYTYIVLSVLKISSFSGKLKSFSTCSSHLTVVFIFYGTLIAMYVLPKKEQSQTIKKIMSLLYTVFTPLLNPFIYSLRNKYIRDALRNALFKKKDLLFKA